MQRFLKDLFAIKAEIICEHFSPEFLLSFLTAEERQNHETMIKAVQILKHDKLRGMMIDLETDGCYNQEATGQKVLDTLNDINTMIGEAMKMVSVQPALLPLYRQMIESAVATMPNARQFDVIMEQVFNKIETELNKPEPVKVENANPVVDLERQKISQDYDIKKEQNALKREELNLKKAVELNKTLKNNN